MNVLKFIKIVIILLIPAISQAQTIKHQKELDIIFQSLKEKDYSLIKPLLDSNCKINDLPKGLNDAVVPQLIKQLPAPISYKVISEVKENDGDRVKATYTYESGKTRNQSYLFNSADKIIDLDILEGATSKQLTSSGRPSNSNSLPKRFVASFELKNGIIILKAKINGIEKNFIFDSGAPTLIINSDNLNASEYQRSGLKTSGVVGGSAEINAFHLNEFDWNGVKIENSDVLAMPLNQLELEAKTQIAGLIGFTVFKDYQVTFDYKKNRLIFDLTDSLGNLLAPNASLNTLKTTIVKGEIINHLILIPFSINNKNYKAALDCGASSNLIFEKYFTDVSENKNVKDVTNTSLTGAGKESGTVKTALVKKTKIENINFKNMQFAFQDETLNQLNDGYGLKIEGLLGYPFLRENITSVNYKKKEVIIYK